MSSCRVNIVVLDPLYEDADPLHYAVLLASPVTLVKIREVFPFEGIFHFRVKITNENFVCSLGQCWKDIINADEDLSGKHNTDNCSSIEMQALYLDLEEQQQAITADNDDSDGSFLSYEEYIDEVTSVHDRNGGFLGRASRYPVEDLGIKGSHRSSTQGYNEKTIINKIKSVGANTLKKAHVVEFGSVVKTGATNMWNSIMNSATTFINSQMSAAVLSDISEENLAQLSEDLATFFTDKNPNHMNILQNLWSSYFLNQIFQRESPIWKEAGFQKNDPILDLKTTGILALKAGTYMGQTYPARTQQMLSQNKDNLKTKYPFAIVVVNITLLLSELLNIRDQKYLSTSANYWAIFEEANSFFEVFCVCFFHIDSTWLRRGAVRSQFGALIGECKELVSQVLLKGPQSVIHFKQIAVDTGMLP